MLRVLKVRGFILLLRLNCVYAYVLTRVNYFNSFFAFFLLDVRVTLPQNEFNATSGSNITVVCRVSPPPTSKNVTVQLVGPNNTNKLPHFLTKTNNSQGQVEFIFINVNASDSGNYQCVAATMSSADYQPFKLNITGE